MDDVSRARDLLPAAREAVTADGIRAFVCVPIRARQRLLGTLSLGRQTGSRFTDAELSLLECVADQIGLALDNARLYSETRHQLTELERARTAAVRAERLSAIDGLAAGVAHEINNPLTIILGQIHVMLQGDPGEELQAQLHVIDGAARRAAKIVKDLRSFAEPTPAQRAPVSIAALIRQVLDANASRLRVDHVEWQTALEEVPAVWADGAQIGQVLQSLVDNARFAMASANRGWHADHPPHARVLGRAHRGVATTDPASRRTTCRASSTRSSPPRGRIRAAASGSRWPTASSRSTAAASGPRTPSRAARSS